MDMVVTGDKIIITDAKSFVIKDTLECGQVFRYKKTEDGYVLYETDNKIILTEKDGVVTITCKNPDKTIKFFDLDKDYDTLKNKYSNFSVLLSDAINFGKGIRILKQEPTEMLISFIISANNNIPRIQKTIEAICKKCGQNFGDYFGFPSLDSLSKLTEKDFKDMGAGYRSSYLVKTIKMLNETNNLDKIKAMETIKAREELLKFYGVGPKVADCVLLFSLDKDDVFPVDTWIKKIYKEDFNGKEEDIVKISKFFTDTFKEDSGIIQQYLFNYKRNFKEV